MAKVVNVEDYLAQKGSQMERYHLEVLAQDGKLYEKYVSDEALKEVQHITEKVDEALLNNNQEALQLQRYMQSAERKNEERYHEMNQARVLKREEQQAESQQRAGYINAAILLSLIANLGILIAVTLIVLKF